VGCPHCYSSVATERPEHTALDSQRFRCHTCQWGLKERTGTLLNRLQYLAEVIRLGILWRGWDKLSLRDLTGMFFDRGAIFTHEAARG